MHAKYNTYKWLCSRETVRCHHYTAAAVRERQYISSFREHGGIYLYFIFIYFLYVSISSIYVSVYSVFVCARYAKVIHIETITINSHSFSFTSRRFSLTLHGALRTHMQIVCRHSGLIDNIRMAWPSAIALWLFYAIWWKGGRGERRKRKWVRRRREYNVSWWADRIVCLDKLAKDFLISERPVSDSPIRGVCFIIFFVVTVKPPLLHFAVVNKFKMFKQILWWTTIYFTSGKIRFGHMKKKRKYKQNFHRNNKCRWRSFVFQIKKFYVINAAHAWIIVRYLDYIR